MTKTKKALFIIVGIILIALAVVLIMQGIYYTRLDWNQQLELYGSHKDDLCTLNFGQKVVDGFCWAGGILSGLVGAGSILAGFEIISL